MAKRGYQTARNGGFAPKAAFHAAAYCEEKEQRLATDAAGKPGVAECSRPQALSQSAAKIGDMPAECAKTRSAITAVSGPTSWHGDCVPP
jgi:hypothetical protein